ncbi:hypothetical protein ABBQ38_012149 [Trebouxia sp. C0009 RCD-2024]
MLDLCASNAGCQALLALVLQQGLPEVALRLVAAEDFAVLRAPQNSSIAKSILEEVNSVLCGEPGYRAATDAEFADLIWTGLSQGGPKDCHWIVNPIDGLEGFENLRQYGISLALLEHGKVVLAAVACPNLPVASILGIKTWIKDEPSSFSSNEIVEEPAGVYRPLEQSGAQHTTGCLFTALQGCGAFQADLFAKDAEAQSASIRLPIRPFPLGRNQISDLFEHPDDQTFALVAPCESKFEIRGYASHMASGSTWGPTSRLALDGQVGYGVLGRGDAKMLLTGGQDDIWDLAAGMLIAQESGLLVTNGAGVPRSTVAKDAHGSYKAPKLASLCQACVMHIWMTQQHGV